MKIDQGFNKVVNFLEVRLDNDACIILFLNIHIY
jgi:hypothetical protein